MLDLIELQSLLHRDKISKVSNLASPHSEPFAQWEMRAFKEILGLDGTTGSLR